MGFGKKLLMFLVFGGGGFAGLVYSGQLEQFGIKKDFYKSFMGAQQIDVVSYKVNKGLLAITVKERGNLESSRNEDVMCEVEGSTTIIKILPEGSRVRKGELVCELDSASLKDSLTNQQITVQQAEAAYLNSKLTREVAEIAKEEYLNGTYVQDMRQAEGEKALAETEMYRAKDRLAWTEDMYKKGYVSRTSMVSEQANLQKATFSKEQAETKIIVLKEYTKRKMLTDLDSNIEKAKSDELAKEATLNLEKEKENKLKAQIEKCKLLHRTRGWWFMPTTLAASAARMPHRLKKVPRFVSVSQSSACPILTTCGSIRRFTSRRSTGFRRGSKHVSALMPSPVKC